MNNTKLLLFVYILFTSILIFAQNDGELKKNNFESAQELVDSVEYQVKLGQQRVLQLFQDKCSNTVTECETKIYDECGVHEPETLKAYFKDFQLEDCKNKGLEFDYEFVSGRCSNEVDCNSKQSKRIACSMSTLFDDENLRQDIEGHIYSSYAGFANSFVLFYPYKHDAFECGECRDYDPRLRPWYVGAVSGAKNIVLVLDISGSMSGDKIDMAKDAAITVVDTLGHNDKFQVVLFESEAHLVEFGSNKLIKATRNNKNKVIEKLEEIDATGETNFEDAFDLAFDVFDRSDSGDCLNVMLFMTDGTITKGEEDQAKILKQIRNRNEKTKASIFTYSFGDQADKDIPKSIACENVGIWYEVKEDDENQLKSIMSHYYNYLALGFKQFDAQTEEFAVIWSELYEDSSTKQKMVTASAPIIYYNDDNQKQLVGVYAVDVLESQFKDFSDKKSVFDKVQSRGRDQCPTQGLSECTVEYLRDSKCHNEEDEDCGESNVKFTLDSCSENVKGKWQSESGNKDAEFASVCPETTEDDFGICLEWWHWVLIIVGSIAGLVLIVLLIIFLVKKYRMYQFNKKQTERRNSTQYKNNSNNKVDDIQLQADDDQQ